MIGGRAVADEEEAGEGRKNLEECCNRSSRAQGLGGTGECGVAAF